MMAVFLASSLPPIDETVTYLPFHHFLHFHEGFFFPSFPPRSVGLYGIHSVIQSSIYSLNWLTFIEHLHVPDLITCWVCGNEQNRQGPCPLGGQLRNKLQFVRSVVSKGKPQTCVWHALSTQGTLALQESDILKSYYQKKWTSCQSLKMLQEVCLSKTVGIVAPLLPNALSMAGIEEVYLSKLNQTKTNFSLLTEEPFRVSCASSWSVWASVILMFPKCHFIGSLG